MLFHYACLVGTLCVIDPARGGDGDKDPFWKHVIVTCRWAGKNKIGYFDIVVA